MRLAAGGGWTLWPQAMLRGAGLPFARLEAALGPGGEAEVAALARDPWFREAPGGKPARRRRELRTALRYIQRYAAKNEAIGFFGPVGWARLVAGPGEVVPGPVVAERHVSFEPWAVRALLAGAGAQASAEAPVTLRGQYRLVPGGLLGPEGRVALDGEEAALAEAADGRSAAALLAATGVRATVLERMVFRGLLRRAHPVAVARDPGAAVRGSAGAVLDRFEAHRRALGRAAGDAAAVERELAILGEDFALSAGRAPARNHGRSYAGRTPVYHDCRRGGRYRIGSAALAPVLPVLALLGDLARGFTLAIARDLAAEMRVLHSLEGGGAVPLPRFWQATAPLFDAECPPAVARASEALSRGWERVFQRGPEASVAAARASLGALCRAPCPGWPAARLHGPDLMWQAGSAEDLLAGRGLPVVAEFHPGVWTQTTLAALATCPDRDALAREWAADYPEPLVSPIPGEDFARSTQDARLAARHWHLDTGGAYASGIAGADVLRLADFDVERQGARLVARHLGTGPDVDLLALMERRIRLRAAIAFPLGPRGPGPRLSLGGVVIRRARWQGAPPDLPAAGRYRPAARATLRRWWRGLGAPERGFCSLPGEIKPVLVDIRSELSLDMCAAMLGPPGEVAIEEMLPDDRGLWLRDDRGAAYTSELRVTMSDPVAYDPAEVWQPVAAAAAPMPAFSG